MKQLPEDGPPDATGSEVEELPGFDQSWRLRQWLLEAALGRAREERGDLPDEHFDSLAGEAVAALPEQLLDEAIQAAYRAWRAEHLPDPSIVNDPHADWKVRQGFFREVLATGGVPLIGYADAIAQAIVVHVAARRPPPPPTRRSSGPPGRRPLDEAELRSQIREALGQIEARRRRAGLPGPSRPKRPEIAKQLGIGVRTLGHWLARFPGLRQELP